jgi:hypothetical protein
VVSPVGKIAATVFTGPKQLRRPLAASLLAGHTATGTIARFKPKLVGLKSAQSKLVVAKTQATMLAIGASALTGMKATDIAKEVVNGPALNVSNGSGQAGSPEVGAADFRPRRRGRRSCIRFRGRRYCRR